MIDKMIEPRQWTVDFYRFARNCKQQGMETDLARVESAVSPTGADENVRNVLDVTRVPVHRLAHGVVDDRYCDLLQHGGQGSLCNETKCSDTCVEGCVLLSGRDYQISRLAIFTLKNVGFEQS